MNTRMTLKPYFNKWNIPTRSWSERDGTRLCRAHVERPDFPASPEHTEQTNRQQESTTKGPERHHQTPPDPTRHQQPHKKPHRTKSDTTTRWHLTPLTSLRTYKKLQEPQSGSNNVEIVSTLRRIIVELPPRNVE